MLDKPKFVVLAKGTTEDSPTHVMMSLPSGDSLITVTEAVEVEEQLRAVLDSEPALRQLIADTTEAGRRFKVASLSRPPTSILDETRRPAVSGDVRIPMRVSRRIGYCTHCGQRITFRPNFDTGEVVFSHDGTHCQAWLDEEPLYFSKGMP